jgi:hypothetical protein
LSSKGETQGRTRASCTISYKGAGKQAVTAVDSGDGNFAGSSTSAPQTVTVLALGLGLAKLVHVTTSGDTATVRIKLSADGRRLLSAHHRLQIKLTAVQTILGKPKKFATKTITSKTA